MRFRLKLVLCAALALLAAACLLATLASLGVLDGREDEAYLLQARDGQVAVFRLPELDKPQAVADVRLSSLPSSDRAALTAGVRVEGRAALAALLEDLGS